MARMVISDIPADLAKSIRLLAAEHDRTRTDVIVIALRMVLKSPELASKLEELVRGNGSRH